MDNKHMTPNVLKNEPECNCGCGMGKYDSGAPITEDRRNITKLALNMQMLFDFLSLLVVPGERTRIYVKFSSWCRCPVHNERVGGADSSFHMTGGAADLIIHYRNSRGERIYVSPRMCCREALLLNQMGRTHFGGIGVYHNRLHLDIREANLVTWVKKDIGRFESGSAYRYGVDFTEDYKLREKNETNSTD